jgi:tetratricopeptide (TPR) repeat protein/transglutaminase-like putative cysteine protease
MSGGGRTVVLGEDVQRLGITAALAVVMVPGTAWASDTPLYQPVPAWVIAAPAMPPIGEDTPPIALLDFQYRIEKGQVWSYVHQQTRIVSPEMLSQAATLTLPWAPDKGDLIVHGINILRGDKRIDLLAKGQKFTVLRREQSLEQRELTGILTATMAMEGLEVGDVIDLNISITARDAALGGRVQHVMQLVAQPMRIGAGRVRFSWPTATPPQFKLMADGVKATPVRNGDYTELTFALPVAKQKEMPDDAPTRFRHPPLLELASFTDWADVSKTFAPLYVTDGLIAPGSAVAEQVAAIERADQTPIGRAQRALELVQDKIRYLAVGMDGGNYVPQAPAKTWEVRYGDCKAKTLLLLAMLRAMKIEAEPVVASVGLGDFVPERLPSAAAFNHVFVRATIDGQVLWLDGTGSNARMADIRDTPALGYVLPIRAAGAEPMRIATHAAARPWFDVTIDADESGAVDLPSPVKVSAVVRGQMATMLTMAKTQVGPKEQREAVQQLLQPWVGEGQFSDVAITSDSATGEVLVKANGVVGSGWGTIDRRYKRALNSRLANWTFAPDRSRPEWTAIPVAGNGTEGVRTRLRITLPDGGRGFTLDGPPDQDAQLAGYVVKRTVKLSGGVLTMDERFDSTGEEVPAARIPAERDAVATAKNSLPMLVAPADIARMATIAPAAIAATSQSKAIRAVYTAAIAADPDDPAAYSARASFDTSIGDYPAALADLSEVIGKQPSFNLYLQRAYVHEMLNDSVAALADSERARALDPSSSVAIERVANLKAENGDLAGGIALLDQRIALGGESRAAYRRAKASLLGEYGDAAAAIKLYDEMIAEKPGSPNLLNGRCWLKGTRAVALDTALKDCTGSIELSDNSWAALDSRAMVWYRMGRLPEAMADLDAVLAASPDLASSRYLRAAVYKAMKRDADAARDLAVARRVWPTIDRHYARFGIKL